MTAIDQFPPWAVFVISFGLLSLAGELGFRLAQGQRDQGHKDLAAVLLGAILLLLSLMLGFSLSTVEERFAARKTLVIEEANAIGTTFLRADMLPEPHGPRARALLREYLDLRFDVDLRRLDEPLRRADALQTALWEHAVASAAAQPNSLPVSLFVQALNELIDLQQTRLTTVLHQRLPFAILIMLYVIAVLSMVLHGYSAGLANTRAAVLSMSVVASIASVLVLIVDLDRPSQRIFEVRQDALQSVRATMATER
jgi:uncharacterized membrane protein